MKLIRTIGMLLKWRCLHWLPDYLSRQKQRRHRRTTPGNDITDIIVLIVDHYEPSRREGKEGIAKVRKWCDGYRDFTSAHMDSDGVRPQHTWFYRFDYPEKKCVSILNEYVFAGMGEIEFHLHHGNDTAESFETKIREGVAWFNQFGAMISAEKAPQKRFAYIAGDWALDNGRQDASTSGVNTEIGILAKAGCYADFTFPALGVSSQPATVNSIYYATDAPEPKSYNTGVDLEAGVKNEGDLVIFEGPLYIDWKNARMEYGSVESFTPYKTHRLDYWTNADVHVKGRPEWLFFKLHTHGMQSIDSFVSEQLHAMFSDLESRYKQPGYRLHYVTAREAFNIAKAAENGESGNPNEYRDYLIKKPVNTKIICNRPYVINGFSDEMVDITLTGIEEKTVIEMKEGPIERIEGGWIVRVVLTHNKGSIDQLNLTGEGICKLQMKNGTTLNQECTSPYTRQAGAL